MEGEGMMEGMGGDEEGVGRRGRDGGRLGRRYAGAHPPPPLGGHAKSVALYGGGLESVVMPRPLVGNLTQR